MGNVVAHFGRGGVALRRVVVLGLVPALFALAGLAFLLPGASVSCLRDTSVSGAQVLTRAVPNIPGEGLDCGAAQARLSEQQPYAIIALAAVAVGFLLAVHGFRRGPGWCAVAGLVLMVLAGVNVLDANPWDGGIYQINPDSGYWVALLSFAAVGVWQLMRWRKPRTRHPPAPWWRASALRGRLKKYGSRP